MYSNTSLESSTVTYLKIALEAENRQNLLLKPWCVTNLLLSSLYLLLAVYSVFQLSKIFYYGHKRRSYQVGFLLLCFNLTFLRFIFLLLSVIEYGLNLSFNQQCMNWLYWLPLHIEFATFSLLVLFFAHVYHLDSWRDHLKQYFVGAWFAVNTLFLSLLFVPDYDTKKVFGTRGTVREITSICIFTILTAILLKYGLGLVKKMKMEQVQILASNIDANSIKILTLVSSAVFISRIMFNLLSSFDQRVRIIVTNGDIKDAVISFVFFLIWELIPVSSVLIIFRHIPNPLRGDVFSGEVTASYSPLYSQGLFQNPNRYDDFDNDQPAASNSPAMSNRYTSQYMYYYVDNEQQSRPLIGSYDSYGSNNSPYSKFLQSKYKSTPE